MQTQRNKVQDAARPRRRRRAVLKNPEDYDRTPELASYSETSGDALREVIVDPEQPEQLSGREFYEQERPPHHGE